MQTTFIYVLKDPDSGETRYIGKSNNPFQRLNTHLWDTRKNPRTDWIASLRLRGRVPHLELLDEVPHQDWQFWEREYIRVFRAVGLRLLNSTAGGDGGMDGKPVSEATRRKISEALRDKKKSPEHVRNSAAARTGLKRNPGFIKINQRQRFNKKTSRNTSGFVGITWDKQTCQWRAGYMVSGKTYNLGRFDNKQQAVGAREAAIAQLERN